MPTKRTIQELYDLFQAGQAEGSITPDRVQDLILSLRPGYGRISLSSQVQTDIATVNVYQKLEGVTVLGPGAFTFSMPENGRLQCNCPVPSLLRAEAVVSLQNGSQKDFELALAKNGTILPETAQLVRFGPGGGKIEAVVIGDFVQEQGDHVEVWVRNLTDATNVTATRVHLRAMTFVL